MRAGETEAQNGYSHSAEPRRGPGCSQTCAVAPSPTSPPRTVRTRTVSATGPPVHTPRRSPMWPRSWSLERHQEYCPATWHCHRRGSPAQVPDGNRATDGATVPPRCFGRLGRAAPESWEAANPVDVQPLAPARRVVAVPCVGLGSLCSRAGAGGGHRPPHPRQGSSLGRRGVQHATPRSCGTARGQQQLFLGLSLGVSLMESVK